MLDSAAVETSPSGQMRGLLTLLRPKQWVKNTFVLAPLVFTGEFLDLGALTQAILAALLFCVASSATYVVNDIHDIDQDRIHPRKSRTRPLATGLVSKPTALFVLGALYAMLLWGWFLTPAVIVVIVGYLLLNVAYTFVLKHEPVLDIFTIAIGFVLRVYAGAVALAVPVSTWMFVTTLCLALYLAAVKRRQELALSGNESRAVLAKYSASLVDRYAEMSATGALVFYALFVMSARPELVLSVPLVLFGLFRYWYVVESLDGGESPTDVLFSDWQLFLVVTAWVGFCAWSLWPSAG